MNMDPTALEAWELLKDSGVVNLIPLPPPALPSSPFIVPALPTGRRRDPRLIARERQAALQAELDSKTKSGVIRTKQSSSSSSAAFSKLALPDRATRRKMATSSDSAVPVKKPANAPPSAVLDALIKSVRDISLSAPASIPRPGTPPRPTASIPQPGTPPRPTASIRRPDTPRCTASILRPDTPRRNSVPTNMNQLAAATLENPPIAKVTQRDPRKPAKVGSASQVLAASSKRRHDDDEVDCAGPESEEGASRVIAKRNRPNSCRGSLTFTMDEAKVLANDFEQRMVEQGLKDKVEREKMAKHMDSMKELKELRESLEAERLEKERMMGMVAKNLKELLMRQKMKKDEEEALERERKNLLVARNNRRKLEREKRELDEWKARTRKERVADRIATLKKESSKADLNSVTLDRLPVAAKPEDIDVKELRELFAKMTIDETVENEIVNLASTLRNTTLDSTPKESAVLPLSPPPSPLNDRGGGDGGGDGRVQGSCGVQRVSPV